MVIYVYRGSILCNMLEHLLPTLICAGRRPQFDHRDESSSSGGAISNYPYQFGRPFVDGAIANQPQVLVNGQPVATQADVKNRYPDGSVEFAVIAVVIPAIPASGSLTLTFQNQNAGSNTPLTQAQMLASTYNFDASMALTPVGGTAQAASARTMLQNGDYKLWTSGPVAQTIMLGDDTAARKYDIGFGDGYHPFRPRFYATFWPATHQVFVRCVGENGLTTELEDLAYKLSITSNGATVYSADLSGTQTTHPKIHWALSRWTREVLDRRHALGPGQHRQQSGLSRKHPVPAEFRHLDRHPADLDRCRIRQYQRQD